MSPQIATTYTQNMSTQNATIKNIVPPKTLNRGKAILREMNPKSFLSNFRGSFHRGCFFCSNKMA